MHFTKQYPFVGILKKLYCAALYKYLPFCDLEIILPIRQKKEAP